MLPIAARLATRTWDMLGAGRRFSLSLRSLTGKVRVLSFGAPREIVLEIERRSGSHGS